MVYLNGEQLAQGEAKLVEVIRNNTELFNVIKLATIKEAFCNDIEQEDVFGTDDLTEEDLATSLAEVVTEGNLVPVPVKKGRRK